MTNYLLLDFSTKAILPETMLYTASFLNQNGVIKDQRVIKILSSVDKDRLIKHPPLPIDRNTKIILWQQDWLSSEGGFLLLNTAREIRQNYPQAFIIVGGYLPTLSPDLFVEEKLFDVVLCGYPWASLNWNIVGKQKVTAVCKASHLHQFPESLSLEEGCRYIDDLHALFDKGKKSKLYCTYFTSFHCDNCCPFCFNSCFYKFGGSISKPLDRIIDEIDFLSKKYNIKYIESKDNNIFTDLQHGQNKLKLFAESEKTCLSGNIDVMVKDLCKENIDLLHRAGIRYVFFGLESLQRGVRETLNKGFAEHTLEEALEYGREKNIFFLGNVLLGVMNSSMNPLNIEAVMAEKDAACKMLQLHPNLSLQLRLYMPLLGTPVGDKVWSETKLNGNLDLITYLRLIDTIVNSRAFSQDLPLPSCYESVECIEKAAEVSRAFAVLNKSKQIGHGYQMFGNVLPHVLNLRAKLLGHLLHKGAYNLMHLESVMFEKAMSAVQSLRNNT